MQVYKLYLLMYVYLCKMHVHNNYYVCMTDYMHCIYTRSSAANNLTVYMETLVVLKVHVIDILMLLIF